MPSFSIPNVRLAGVSVAVPPARAVPISELNCAGEEGLRAKGCESNLLASVRQADIEKTQADFCVAAAKQLLSDLQWDIADIKVIVMATITPDYPIPATSFVAHEMLGATKSCVVFDVTSGGIGLLQGMQTVASMLSNGHLKKGLLLTGCVPKVIKEKEFLCKSGIEEQILGDCGAVLAFEYDPSAEALHFDLGGDGGEYETEILLKGCSRFPVTLDVLQEETGSDRFPMKRDDTKFKTVARDQLTKSLKRVVAHAGKEVEDIDLAFVNPQGAVVEDHIRQELGFSRDRFRSLVPSLGIRGSGAIPAAMIADSGTQLRRGKADLLFGVFDAGLSWGSALVSTDRLVCPEIVEF